MAEGRRPDALLSGAAHAARASADAEAEERVHRLLDVDLGAATDAVPQPHPVERDPRLGTWDAEDALVRPREGGHPRERGAAGTDRDRSARPARRRHRKTPEHDHPGGPAGRPT